VFVRLKLRLLRNSFRGAGWRIALSILGLVGGAWFALVGFGFFSISGLISARDGYSVAVLGGTAVVFGWVALPLLMFGVDETLDPSRFASLPVRRPVLLRGLYAGAFLGIPPVMTLAATQGLVLGAAIRGGVGAAVAAFAGTVLGLLLCVAVSRAVTTAMATALRSRRSRDTAVVLLALLAAGMWPLQVAGASVVQFLGPQRLVTLARVLAWTPVGAPYSVGLDVAAGRWPVALARLALAALAILLLLRWWAATLPAAMLGTARMAGPRASAGAGLVPGLLRRLPSPRLAALMARDMRYWWRDPRRRSTLISALMGAIAVPVVLTVTSGRLNLPFGLAVAGAFTGGVLANQFGFDGSALAANLLAGVPGRIEVAARLIAATALFALVLIGSAVAIGAVGPDGRVAQAIGAGFAAYGASAAVATILSVLLPYALPETYNPFALGTGTGVLRGFAGLGPAVAGAGAATPIVLGATALGPVLGLGLGLVLGGGLLTAGGLIAGARLDERAPEVLAEVTPRR
jgi:ABC-2 type transport system permease protein